MYVKVGYLDTPSPGDLAPEETRERRDPPGLTGQIVFHLTRGAALLEQGRTGEAKAAIDRALALSPEDPQGQCLLANAYFRLGLYPNAIEIWQKLVVSHPVDSTLRVNLSLAFLKTGQPKLALAHLEEAVSLAPKHRRAWRYLGLAYWRLDRPQDARAAFLEAGHRPMAERMDAMARVSLRATDMVTKVRTRQPSISETSGLAGEVRDALQQLSGPNEALDLDTRTLVGDAPAAVQTAPEAPTLLYMSKLPELQGGPEPSTFCLGEDGELQFAAEQEAYVRLRGMRFVQGEFRTQLVSVTSGQALSNCLGGEEPILRWLGPTRAVFSPPKGRRFLVWNLAESKPLFMSESAVWGFDGAIRAAVGSVVKGGDSHRWLRLEGTGTVALCLQGDPCAVALDDDELRLETHHLVGWTGAVRLRHRTGTEPYGVWAPPLVVAGSGTVFVS